MVQNGGTIVMHGVTHQYRGITAVDYEFWDETTNRAIREETVEGITRKLDMEFQEFMKNGLYPLVWETPHYTASTKLYETVSKYFSTGHGTAAGDRGRRDGAVLSLHDKQGSLRAAASSRRTSVCPARPGSRRGGGGREANHRRCKINLAGAGRVCLQLFHAFVDLDLLKEIVEGVQALGYTYMDVKDLTHWSGRKTGSSCAAPRITRSRLTTSTFRKHIRPDGEIVATTTSEKRIKGAVTRHITLEPGQTYKAEPAEMREKSPTLAERVISGAGRMYERLTGQEESWQEARVAILWNQFAEGAAFQRPGLLCGVMKSVNIAVDTLFVGQKVRPRAVQPPVRPLHIRGFAPR